MDPEPWTLLMERLQQAAPGCDKNCKGANRMMRMAGSHYINRNGESQGQVQIISADGPRYSAEELDSALPPLPAAPQSWRKKYSTDSARGLLQIADALECIPPRKGGDVTYGDYRQILWGLKDACIAAGADEDVAIQLMEQHSPSKTSQWNVAQVCRSGGEKVTAGTFWWHAKKHGWRPNHE